MERYWVWEYGLFEKNPKRVDSLNPETTLEVVKLADVQATVAALQQERDAWKARTVELDARAQEVFANGQQREAEMERLVARLDAERAKVRELEKLAYIGDHQFPDLTWKSRCEEAVTDLRHAQSQLAQRGEEVKRLSTCGTDHSTPWWQVRCEDLETALTQLQALVRALIYSDNAPEHDRAWFALRATLDALTPAGRQE